MPSPSKIFRSSYLVLGGEDVFAGGQGLAAAGVTVLLMTTGVVCGTYLWVDMTGRLRLRSSRNLA